jgi:hypothetical protein
VFFTITDGDKTLYVEAYTEIPMIQTIRDELKAHRHGIAARACVPDLAKVARVDLAIIPEQGKPDIQPPKGALRAVSAWFWRRYHYGPRGGFLRLR